MMNSVRTYGSGLLLASISLAAGLHAQALAPAGTGVSLAVAGIGGAMQSDLSGSMNASTSVAPRLEASFGATPRLGVLAAWSRQSVTIDEEAFDIASLDLGLRYTGFVGRVWRPFADVGMARRAFRYEAPQLIRATTLAPWGAVGFMRRSTGPLGVEVALTAASSTFDQFTVDDVVSTLQPVQTRFLGARVGVRYWIN